MNIRTSNEHPIIAVFDKRERVWKVLRTCKPHAIDEALVNQYAPVFNWKLVQQCKAYAKATAAVGACS